MKKLISVVIVTCIIASIAVVSFADVPEIDFTSLSDEELLALKLDVESELSMRNKNGIVLPVGDIKCPEGIDAGSYKLTMIDGAPRESIPRFAVQSAEDKTVASEHTEIGGSYQFSIEEGQRLVLHGIFLISKPEKISF